MISTTKFGLDINKVTTILHANRNEYILNILLCPVIFPGSQNLANEWLFSSDVDSCQYIWKSMHLKSVLEFERLVKAQYTRLGSLNTLG